ncbi:MAG: hypothetical protein LUH08_00715 [Ruminococcus sp.]|nr:hypothetical protein [Ruminococcus sp.]
MKKNKLFTILLAIVVGISLCACSNTSDASEIEETGASLEEQVIGIWKSNRYDYYVTMYGTTKIYNCLEIYKGGTARELEKNPLAVLNTKYIYPTLEYTATWEAVDDDIINLYFSAGSYGYVYDEGSDTLTETGTKDELTYERIDESDEDYATLIDNL